MRKITKIASGKQSKLTLDKQIVAILTGDMLKNVAGGLIPETRSACDSRCTC